MERGVPPHISFKARNAGNISTTNMGGERRRKPSQVQSIQLTQDGKILKDKMTNKEVRLKYTMPDSEQQATNSKSKKNNQGESSDEDELLDINFPPNIYLSSDLVMTAKNLEAAEEYLQKADVFHHLWQPEEEVSHIRKAIAIYNEAKELKAKKL